jgi:hypothetical protein
MATNLPGSKYAKLLAPEIDKAINNGTIYGGLAHVLQSYMAGQGARANQTAEQEAMEAATQGMSAQPWVNPDTGEKMGTAGGYEGGIFALQNQQGNPYAGRLASQLMMNQAQAGMEDQRWDKRFERQSAADMEKFQAQQEALDRRHQQQLAAQREMAQMRAAQGGQDPSSIREWQAFQQMTPDQQQQYLTMKRANPYLNLGDVFAQPDPLNPGQVRGQIGVGVKPERHIEGGTAYDFPGVPGGPRGLPEGWSPAGGENPSFVPQDQGMEQQGQFQPPQSGPVVRDLPQSREAREEAEALASKERGRKAQQVRAGTTVVQDLGRALDLVGEMAQGDGVIGANMRSVRSGVKGTPEARVIKFKESALSNVGLDTLQTMRENSPTGGALGQVPIQQQLRLEKVLGDLEIEQPVPDIEDNMRRVMNIYTDIMYGSPMERAAAVAEGRMDPAQSQAIDRLYQPLNFDDRGEYIGREQWVHPEIQLLQRQQAIGGQQPMPQQPQMPQQPVSQQQPMPGQRRRYNPATGQIE